MDRSPRLSPASARPLAAASEPFALRRGPRLAAAWRRHGLSRRPPSLRAVLDDQRITAGNRIEFYDAGREALPAMLAAIGAAQRFVHLETYILRGDATGARFLAALAERARAGVAVRLLYDAVGSIGELSDAQLAELRAAGGEAVAFQPLWRGWPSWTPRRRNHRKILVVDGRVAFTGGLNIGDEYDAGAQDGPDRDGWRDTHLRIEGPAVRDLGAVFLESWFRASAPPAPWRKLIAEEPAPAGDECILVIPDGPSYPRRRTRDFLLSQLAVARERVWITTAYFTPGRAVLAALADAAERGVDVRLLLAGRSDHAVLRRAARWILPQLLRRGVRVFEYHGAVLHAKSAVFDGHLGWAGTSNLDRQSFEHSYEVNVVMEGGTAPARLAALFQQDLEHATAVRDDTLARRGLGERILDALAALLLPLV